jgi:hypothetical protein
MSCVCDQCRRHAQTLGLPDAAPTPAAIHHAYRAAAKRWHPDRFAKNPSRQAEAEEHFKLIQAAYAQLTEHRARPVVAPVATIFLDPAARPATPPPFTFGNAPGCFIAPHFPPHVYNLIASHIGAGHRPLGIVDLTRPGAPTGPFAQFLLLEANSLIVRGALGIVSMLWYSEMGDISLVDRRINGQLSLWQRLQDSLTGPRPNYTLKIHRRTGKHFYSLAAEADDSVKRVIYNFLLRMKSQQQH